MAAESPTSTTSTPAACATRPVGIVVRREHHDRHAARSRRRQRGKRAGAGSPTCARRALMRSCDARVDEHVVDQPDAADRRRDRDERLARDGRPPARASPPRRPRSTPGRSPLRRGSASPASSARAASSLALRDRSPRRHGAHATSAGARRRASASSSTLRLDIASPSGSRTVGQTSMRTGKSRSRTMRRMSSACCASFCPKNASSGCTMFSSLVTTVATPRKCPAPRMAPSRGAREPATSTVVAKPGG